MRHLNLLLHLAVAGLAIEQVCSVAPAYAQSGPVFEASGLIEVVPPTGVIGDGATPADVYIVALNPSGAPMTGVSFKAAASGGSTSAVTDAGGGLYRFTFTPPKLDQLASLTITLKAKIGKDSVTKTFTVQVAPPRQHAVAIASNPGTLTLGQDKTATLSINLSGGDRNALNGADLKIVASSGKVENLTNLGGGQFSALYTVPTVNYPHVAVISVVDRADPSHTYGTLAVALAGKVDYPVTVAPNAKVLMKIGGQQFGPVQADAQGRARVPVIVPPGVSTGEKIQIDANNQSVSETIDLKVPEAKRISVVPMATALPSDARAQVPVRAVVTTPDGKPDGNANVVFTTTAGVISAGKHEGNGVYSATFTPPNGNTAAQATISAYLSDKPTTQTDSLALNLVPVRPSKVTLTAEPSRLPPGADSLKVFAKVAGPDGSGLGSRTVQLTANGGKLKDAVKDLRNGDYQGVFTTTGTGPVEVMSLVSATATGNPLNRVLVLPARGRLPADGLSNTGILIATLDEYGYPVPNVPVVVKLTSGDGALPQQATTNAEGVAVLYYTAGRKNLLVNIEANANGKVGAASVLQAPDSVAAPTLPTSGQAAEVALANEWKAGLGGLRVEREGATGMVVPGASAVTPVSVGRASRASLASEPASVAPGGTVRLRVKITDDAGTGIGGQSLDFLTSGGTVSPVSDLGGGTYEATLSVPPGATADVKVSVATSDGAASSFIKVPIGGGTATAWTTESPFATQPQPEANPFAAQPQPEANPFSTAKTEPAPTPTPTPAPTNTVTTPGTTSVAKVTKPVSPDDRPWLRVRAGGFFGGYHLDQTPTNPSKLFENAFGVDSGTYGGQLNARAFIPTVKYLGAEVSGWVSYWQVDATGFCEVLQNCAAGGTLDDFHRNYRAVIIPRYPFDVGNNRFWVGARIGGAWSDVPYVAVSQNSLGIEHDTLLGGLAIGAELGADIGEHFFLLTSINEGFAGVSAPYETRFGLEAGYAFTKNVYVDLGYDLSVRSLDLLVEKDDTKVGQIDDMLNALSVSVGVQY